jgi:methyl-accepting chemotaxis protein
MSWVANLTLRNKFIVLLFLPVMSLLMLSAVMIKGELDTSKDLSTLNQTGELSRSASVLVHEIQIERGRSGGFLASGGTVFRDELLQQRLVVDKAWKRLETVTVSHQVDLSDVVMQLLKRRAKTLADTRNKVDKLSILPREAVGHYSTISRELLGILQTLASTIQHRDTARNLEALLNLARAKEAAGQERAEGSSILAMGDGDKRSALTTRLIELAAEQRVYFQYFLAGTTDETRHLYRSAQQSDCMRRYQDIRPTLYGGKNSIQPTPEEWFSVTSCRIDQLRILEQQYTAKLGTLIVEQIASGQQSLYLILSVALLPVLPSLLLILMVARNVKGMSQRLLVAMREIASGNFNVAMPPKTGDELGSLSAGLDRLRQQLHQSREAQRQQLAKERQLHNELATRSDQVQSFAEQISTGDLRGRLEEDGTVLNELAHYLNHMAGGLVDMTTGVRDTGVSLSSSVRQVQAAVSEQSAGANEQAAALNETITTLEQIRATSTQTQEKAQMLGEMAEKARSEGEHGRQVVDESVAGMEEVQNKVDTIAQTILSLNQGTQRIGEITSVVNDIARQLRLLSLNAAIEATKAGESGKGFGVVALEVKQLAEQSKSATEQVQGILEHIRNSTDQAVMATEDGAKGVTRGLGLVERAGDVIRSLELVVRDTNVASKQIVAAVRQEAVGIEQISNAMSDINTVTRQFVGATDNTRLAALDMGRLAQNLNAAVNRYRL